MHCHPKAMTLNLCGGAFPPTTPIMPRIATNALPPESHEVEFVRRKHFAGSSASGTIGPVSYISEGDDMTWKRSCKAKRDIYGKDNRIAPGGRTPGIDTEMAKKLMRKDDDIEPVFYWSYPYQLHEDICRCFGARMIVALTVGDGAIALAAMLMEKPFVGFCLTQEHRMGVRLHLANCVYVSFMTEGSPFYDARIAQDLQNAGVTKTNASGIVTAGAEPNPQPKKAPPKKPSPSGGNPEPATLPKKHPHSTSAAHKGNEPASKKPKQDVAANMKRALAALADEGDGDVGGDDHGGHGDDDGCNDDV